MNELADQNINIANKRKKFPLYIILIIILLLSIVIAGCYYYGSYIRRINIVNNINGSQQDEEYILFEGSVFEEIIDGDSDQGSTADINHLKLVREATLNAMMVGPSVFKVPENDINSYLPDSCIVLKYVDSNTAGTLILIGSTDTEYNHKIGDKVDFFDYNFPAQNVVVLTEEGIYKTLKDLDKYSLREYVRPNSRLVFSCAPSSCNGGDVSWVLVLMRDLNL